MILYCRDVSFVRSNELSPTREQFQKVSFTGSDAKSKSRERFQETRAGSKDTENFEQYGIGFKLLQKQGFQPVSQLTQEIF
jgi:hypothetical protein